MGLIYFNYGHDPGGHSSAYGCGYGYGYGFRDGSGDGSGFGFCDGSGFGYGSGYGFEYANGSGDGFCMDNAEYFMFSAKVILKEKNAEIRAVMIRATGLEKFVQDAGAECIEKNDAYELLNINVINGTYRPYLKMLNPSTGVWHIEGVHPDCKTIKQAIEWRNQTVEIPIIIT